MDSFVFGLSMTLIGMGGTVFTLWLLTLSIIILKKIFPHNKEERNASQKGDIA